MAPKGRPRSPDRDRTNEKCSSHLHHRPQTPRQTQKDVERAPTGSPKRKLWAPVNTQRPPEDIPKGLEKMRNAFIIFTVAPKRRDRFSKKPQGHAKGSIKPKWVPEPRSKRGRETKVDPETSPTPEHAQQNLKR